MILKIILLSFLLITGGTLVFALIRGEVALGDDDKFSASFKKEPISFFVIFGLALIAFLFLVFLLFELM